jgi:hypothetical protein
MVFPIQVTGCPIAKKTLLGQPIERSSNRAKKIIMGKVV